MTDGSSQADRINEALQALDESLDDVSTFKFKVTGNIDNPEIERLD